MLLSKELANFLDLSAKPEMLYITISQLRFVSSPKALFPISSSSDK